MITRIVASMASASISEYAGIAFVNGHLKPERCLLDTNWQPGRPGTLVFRAGFQTCTCMYWGTVSVL